MAIVPSDSLTPASTHSTGMNHRLYRILKARVPIPGTPTHTPTWPRSHIETQHVPRERTWRRGASARRAVSTPRAPGLIDARQVQAARCGGIAQSTGRGADPHVTASNSRRCSRTTRPSENSSATTAAPRAIESTGPAGGIGELGAPRADEAVDAVGDDLGDRPPGLATTGVPQCEGLDHHHPERLGQRSGLSRHIARRAAHFSSPPTSPRYSTSSPSNGATDASK